MDTIDLPQHIDDPLPLLLWTTADLGPVYVALMLGLFLDQEVVCVSISLVLVHFYHRYRDNRPDGFLIHVAYWLGLLGGRGYSLINPYRRLFTP